MAARPENSLVRFERGRFFAARSRPEQAADDFARALSLGVLEDMQEEILGIEGEITDSETKLRLTKALERLSTDILTDPAIGDRVRAVVAMELFARLDPLARARYWVKRGHWTEAAVDYQTVLDTSDPNIPKDDVPVYIERGRLFAARSRPRDAATDFVNSYILLTDRGARRL